MKIIFDNQQPYQKDQIDQIIRIIRKYYRGMPITNCRKLNFDELTCHQFISIFNTYHVQQDIFRSHLFREEKETICPRLKDQIKKDEDLLPFLQSLKMPFRSVIKKIKRDCIDELPISMQKQIEKMNQKLTDYDHLVSKHASQYEKILERFLDKQGIPYQTEEDIRKSNEYSVTPDILFIDPVKIVVNGMEDQIKWMDAKSYFLTNTPFIIHNLKKQAKKYNQVFGKGAFVFRYGITEGITIPGAVIIDGSKI